jgi:hypothetical protein
MTTRDVYQPNVVHDDGAGGSGSLIRNFFGVVLLCFGIAVALWILVSLIGLVRSESVPPLVAAVLPEADEPLKIGASGREVFLPREAFKPVGYLLVCFVYAIGAGLAGVLINGGVSLLQPDLAKVLRRAMERLERGASRD